MGKKVSSVDAMVCVATIAHSQWKSLVTWTDLARVTFMRTVTLARSPTPTFIVFVFSLFMEYVVL